MRVLIADDQPLVRTGLRAILEAAGHEVVAEAEDGRSAVDQALELRPDVCLMDIRMPIMDGLDATLRLAGPDTDHPIPIVIVTTFDDDDYVHRAIRNGASGFILKDAGPNLLLEALEAAQNGEALVSPSITVRLLNRLAGTNLPHQPHQPYEPLSSREEEVTPPRRDRSHQRRDRQRALHLDRNREEPLEPHLHKARRPQPRRTRSLGLGHRTNEPRSSHQLRLKPSLKGDIPTRLQPD